LFQQNLFLHIIIRYFLFYLSTNCFIILAFIFCLCTSRSFGIVLSFFIDFYIGTIIFGLVNKFLFWMSFVTFFIVIYYQLQFIPYIANIRICFYNFYFVRTSLLLLTLCYIFFCIFLLFVLGQELYLCRLRLNCLFLFDYYCL
jgi:hypothetical protein